MSEGTQKSEGKLEVVASRSFPYYSEMYQLIDFLNKNLKGKGVMFGLKKEKATERLNISIYEFE
jgi:hypothetical protein